VKLLNIQKSFLQLVIAAAITFSAVNSYADGITVTQSIDRTEAAYEDIIQMEVKLTWDGPPHAFLIEGPLRPLLDRLKVTRYSSSVSSKGSGAEEQTTKIYTFQLAPTISGTGKVSPIEIKYVSFGDTIPVVVVTDLLEISIASPVSRKTTENDEFSLVKAGLMAVLFIAISLTGIIIFLKRKRTNVDVDRKSPKEIFGVSLAELKIECASDYKRFQTGLYKLITSFLVSQYKIQIKGLSCDEIIAAMVNTDMQSSHRDKFGEWLKKAEREKYSPSAAPPGEAMRVESEIQKFLEMIK